MFGFKETRAWNPKNFVCLWSTYIKFPLRSNIVCKTPEFAKRPIFVHQPHYHTTIDELSDEKCKGSFDSNLEDSPDKKLGTLSPKKGSDGYIILLYCNSFAKINITKYETNWPFDFDDFMTEFEEITAAYERKMRRKLKTKKQCHDYRDGKFITPSSISKEEMEKIESKLDIYVQDILKVKRQADRNIKNATIDQNRIVDPSPSYSQSTHAKLGALEDMIKSTTVDDSLTHHHEETMFNNMPLYELNPINFSLENLNLSSGSSFALKENSDELPIVDVQFGRHSANIDEK